MALKFCPNCGSKIFQDSNFCSNCGEPLQKYKEQDEENANAEIAQIETEIEDVKEIETDVVVTDETKTSSIDVAPENEIIENDSEQDEEVLVEENSLQEEEIIPLPKKEDFMIEETPMESEAVEEEKEDISDDSVETIEEAEEEIEMIEEPEEESEAIEEIIIDKEYVKEEPEESMSESDDEKTIKILGIPEWAFYTGLIVIGIVAILALKLTNTTIDGQNETTPTEIVKGDSIAADTTKTEAVDVEEINDKVEVSEPQPVAPAQNPETSLPKQSGLDTDSAYHVIISTIGDKAKADELAKTCAYKGAYVISSDGKNRIAVFRSLKKADAQLYLDSVVKKDVPDAWLYSGTAK